MASAGEPAVASEEADSGEAVESAVVADEQADRLRMAAQAANVRAGRRAWDMVLLVMVGLWQGDGPRGRGRRVGTRR